MNQQRRAAVVVSMIQQLQKQGSWTGETHVQKATYFLKELTGVPLSYEFLFYKFGPFSFDLRDELTALKVSGFINLLAQPPYGPSLHVTKEGEQLVAHYLGRLSDSVPKSIEFVSQNLGSLKVSELERWATALYVRKATPNLELPKVAEAIHDLKPHVPVPEAQIAAASVQELEARWLAAR